MIEPDPTNIRNRINNYTDKDRDLKMLFKAVYLLGAMECEMLGEKYDSDSKTNVYGPTGNDVWEKTVEVNGNKIDTVFFRIQTARIRTAKTRGKPERTVLLPKDFEPWAKELHDYFKEKGDNGKKVFPFKRMQIRNRVIKSKIFEDLEKPKKYTGKEKRRSFILDNLRSVRRKELEEEYGFKEAHLEAYGIMKLERRRTPKKSLNDSEIEKLQKEYLLLLCKNFKPVVMPFYSENNEEKRAEALFDQIINHPQIKEVSSALFKTGNYRNAVLDAAIRLEEMVKEKANYPKDSNGKELSGVRLMHKVFDSNNPLLSWCRRETQIGKDELEGYKLIFAGTVLGIRNTKAHAVFEIDPMRAIELLTLITLLAELVDASEVLQGETEAS